MSETEFAWAAGFIEGEGSVKFWQRLRASTGRRYFEPSINADNTIKEYLLELQRLFGGSICLAHTKGRPIGKYFCKHDCWRWGVTNLKALNACQALIPYLHAQNRKRAELVAWFYRYHPPRLRSSRGVFQTDAKRRWYHRLIVHKIKELGAS